MQNQLVLVVDDDRDNRVMMRYFLESWGYAVELAEDGVEGIDKARSLSPGLILLDLEMPVMDGFEACRRIKDDPETEHIPVMLFTAREATADKIRGIRGGADDYVVKTVEPEEIQARIEMILRRSQRYERRESTSEEAVLCGSLEEKSFPEAFQLAMAYGQSGTLSMIDGTKEGQVFLVDGNAVHAELERFTGESAFYRFCTWSKGLFHYRVGATSEQRTIESSSQSLVLEATRRLDEWVRISSHIPSQDVVPVRTEAVDEPVSLTRGEWRLIQRINGRASLRDIGECLHLDEYDTGRTALDLLSAGVISFDAVANVRDPLFDAVPELREEIEGDEPFRLTAAQWRLIATINGQLDAGALATVLGMAPEEAVTKLEELDTLGFIDLDTRGRARRTDRTDATKGWVDVRKLRPRIRALGRE